MKEKLQDKTLKSSRRIQILTIAPASWSGAKVADFFCVSEYMVRGKLENLQKQRAS